MIYFIQCEMRFNGELTNIFIYSFAYKTEKEAKERLAEYIESDVEDGFKKVDENTAVSKNSFGDITEYKYKIESLVCLF